MRACLSLMKLKWNQIHLENIYSQQHIIGDKATYLVELFKDSHGAGLLVVLPAQLNLEGLDVGDAELPDFEGGRQDSALEGAPASHRLVRVQGRVGRLPKHRLNPCLDGRDSGGSANNLHRVDWGENIESFVQFVRSQRDIHCSLYHRLGSIPMHQGTP